MNETVEQYLAELQKTIDSGSFIKLTLSNYKGSEPHLQRITVRTIETKKGGRLFFQTKYDQRDIVKNHSFEKGMTLVRQHLNEGFRNAHLFSTSGDLQLDIGKRNARLNRSRPTLTKAEKPTHDREKKYFVDQNAYFLKALGITTDTGQIRADQRDKWKQINKFVEVLDGLFRTSNLKDNSSIRFVDMGSGKGYLTFAANEHFSKRLGLDVKGLGVDTRADMIELCNSIAVAGEYSGLRFAQGSIDNTELDGTDILIALHACDTATDDALFKGITMNAAIIVASPCCHREIRKQLKAPDEWIDILKHAVLLERTAETITDGIRAQLLERSGYATKMFEFVPTEHTPKNNLIVATKRSNTESSRRFADEQLLEFMQRYGIKNQRLADLLGPISQDVTNNLQRLDE